MSEDDELRERLRRLVDSGTEQAPDDATLDRVLRRGRRKRRRRLTGAVAAVVIATAGVGAGTAAVRSRLAGQPENALPAASLHPAPETVGGVPGWRPVGGRPTTPTTHGRAPGTGCRLGPIGGDVHYDPSANQIIPVGRPPSEKFPLYSFVMTTLPQVAPAAVTTPVSGIRVRGQQHAHLQANVRARGIRGSVNFGMTRYTGGPRQAADAALGCVTARRHVEYDGTVLQSYGMVWVFNENTGPGGYRRVLDVYRSDGRLVRLSEGSYQSYTFHNARPTLTHDGPTGDTNLPLSSTQLMELGLRAGDARLP